MPIGAGPSNRAEPVLVRQTDKGRAATALIAPWKSDGIHMSSPV
ncbi:hypothetical protein [Streptococcus ruminantium]|nr:hypothetical protein [Streptococcus ruminantium]